MNTLFILGLYFLFLVESGKPASSKSVQGASSKSSTSKQPVASKRSVSDVVDEELRSMQGPSDIAEDRVQTMPSGRRGRGRTTVSRSSRAVGAAGNENRGVSPSNTNTDEKTATKAPDGKLDKGTFKFYFNFPTFALQLKLLTCFRLQ